jgi:hypothetical protein
MSIEYLNALSSVAETFKTISNEMNFADMITRQNITKQQLVFYFWASPIYFEFMDKKKEILQEFDFKKNYNWLQNAPSNAFGHWENTTFLETMKQDSGLTLAFSTLSFITKFLNKNFEEIKNENAQDVRKEIFCFIRNEINIIIKKYDNLNNHNNMIKNILDNTFRRNLKLSNNKSKEQSQFIPTKFTMISKDEISSNIDNISKRIKFHNESSRILLDRVSNIANAVTESYMSLNLPAIVNNYKELNTMFQKSRMNILPYDLQSKKAMLEQVENNITKEMQTLKIQIDSLLRTTTDAFDEIGYRLKSNTL